MSNRSRLLFRGFPLVAGLALLAGCATSTPRTITAEPIANQAAPSTAQTASPPAAQKPSPDQAARLATIAADEPVQVCDKTGSVRGTIGPSELDRQNDRVAELLGAPTDRTTAKSVAQPTAEQLSAAQVIEAIPVRDAKGVITGYFGGHFYGVSEYQGAKARASTLVGP